MAASGCSRFSSTYLCVWVQSDEEMPNGRPSGKMSWETYDGERTSSRSDVAFVKELHRAVAQRWALNSSNVFAYGHSSGSMFVLGRLMYEANDVFRGVAGSAGRLWQSMPFYNNRESWSRCVHVSYSYGALDPRGWAAYNGLWGPNYGIEASAVRLARSNGCSVSSSGSNERTRTLRGSGRSENLGGYPVRRFAFPSCNRGLIVNFLNWTNQEHHMPRTAYNQHLEDFFSRVRQSSACRTR